MTTCRQEALRWTHRYAAGGALFALLPLPLSTSAGLATLETHMMSAIGDIYGEAPSGIVTAAAGGTFAVLGHGLKFVASRASLLLPALGPVVRMGIAAAAIESIGWGIVGHFERKHPGKRFARPAEDDRGRTG